MPDFTAIFTYAQLNFTKVSELASYVIYGALILIALWGAYCVIMVWRRVAQSRFRDEEEQARFLETMVETMGTGDVEAATEVCEGDPRAMPQRYSRLRAASSDPEQPCRSSPNPPCDRCPTPSASG